LDARGPLSRVAAINRKVVGPLRFPRRRILVSLGIATVGVAILIPTAVVGAQSGPGLKFAIQHRSSSKFGTVAAPKGALAKDSWSNKARCFGIIPATGEQSYQSNCYGHDEPAVDPISSVPGSGQDITWKFRLPKSSPTRSLLDMGPTFWIGATLNDPSSLANSVFSELQFYPDSTLLPQTGNDINTACTQFGFNVSPAKNVWSICDFSWGLYPSGGNFFETPAYVGVVDKNTNQPLYLHSGDLITVHVFPSGDGTGSNNDAKQVISDLTTHQTGTLIMNSNATTGAGSVANPTTGDGPLSLPYSTNTTDNAMPWGVVDGTPFAFSWEIGHSNFYTHPFQSECVPGQWDCQSYDTSNSGWDAITPFKLLSVTFGVNGHQIAPDSWATNDSQGGVAEDNEYCGGFGPSTGTSLCGFPYYTYNKHDKAIEIGGSYPGTQFDYGQAPKEYAQDFECPGPLTNEFGFLYYCDTPLNPSPPIQ
jgi:hypothetical protein